jgi:hypothetical protein
LQNTGSIAFPTPTIPTHVNGINKFGHPASNGIHPLLLESAIEVQQDKPPRRILPVDFSSNAASTPTNETSRGIDTENDISFLPSTRKIPSIPAQPSQIDRNQLAYDSRFQHEPYVTALLNIAEQTFSGPALRTTAARSFTTSSQVPNDKQVSLAQSRPVETGEPPVRPHPNVQLNDLFRVEKITTGATRRDVVIKDDFSTFASIPDLDLNAPEARQYASSNTMPLVAPCMISAGPPSVQANTNWVKSHDFMDIVHSPDQNSALLPEYPKPPPRGLEPPVNGSQDPWADYVPSPIPEEVQALINAYICGRPFNLFVARSRLYDYWNLSLPEEFGYVMLGFFRVLSVQVRLLFLFVGLL